MKEVYNQYMSSDAPLLEDDLLEPQLRSCKSQMYRARRQNMPPLPAIREDINLEGQWAMGKCVFSHAYASYYSQSICFEIISWHHSS